MEILKYTKNLDPKKYQEETFQKAKEFLESKGYAALLLTMGLGKSAILLALISYLYKNGKINSVLYVGNKGSYLNFLFDQLPKHIDPSIDYYATYHDSATNAKREDEFKLLNAPTRDLSIFCVNTEALSSKKNVVIFREFMRKKKKCLMAIDESSKIKNMSAQRTGVAIELGEEAIYRVIMTGSSVTNGPMDLWSQCAFLDAFALGFNSYYAYRAKFCDLAKESVYVKGGKRQDHIAIAGFKHLDELRNILEKFSIVLTKEECLDLPPKIYETCHIELTPEQAKIYKEFKKEALLAIEDTTVSATIVLAKLTKLHQIACGFVITDDKKVIHLPNKRFDALLEIIEESQGKIVIWAPYTGLIRIIEERLKKEFGDRSTVSYFGATEAVDRQFNAKRFQEENDCRFFVGNPSVGGFGITLTASSTTVYYSNNYSLDQRVQSEDRLHRIGQTKSVTYIDMVARGTMEERVLQVLKSKKDVASAILGSREEAKKFLIEGI